MGWVEDYADLQRDTEIPMTFAIWTGLFQIAAALGRNVFVDMVTFRVYPNMLLVFVAGSGRCRKSTAIRYGEKLLRKIENPPNIISQKVTPEALIGAMRKGSGDDTIVSDKHEGVVIVDELANFMNKKSYEAGLGAVLIPLYDCADYFDYETISRGKEEVTNSCLNLIGGTTTDWMKEVIPETAIGQGLTSRILFVYLEQPAPPQAIPSYTLKQLQEMEDMKQQLIERLSDIRQLKGRVLLSEEAKSWFIPKYNDFYINSPYHDDKYLRGYASRRYIHILKLATLFAVSETMELVILPEHLKLADKLLAETEKMLPSLMQTITSTNEGELSDWVLDKIQRAGHLSKTRLQRATSKKLTKTPLDEILNTLMQAGRVECRPTNTGGRTKYEYYYVETENE